MIEKEFVPYEEALALKELRFNEPCLASYFHAGKRLHITEYINYGEYTTLAPTFSQAFRFFREKYGLKSWIQEHTADTFIYEIRPHKLTDYKEGEVYVYEVYEEAELACLKKLIKIAKEKTMSNNKQIMKLYTQEQVIEVFEKYGNMSAINARNIIDLSESIELPSDEELKKQFDVDEFDPYDLAYLGGAIRMRNLIQGGNNEQRKKH